MISITSVLLANYSKNMDEVSSTSGAERQSLGPVFGIVIIIVLLLLGGIYIFLNKRTTTPPIEINLGTTTVETTAIVPEATTTPVATSTKAATSSRQN
jgi:hypothetical protein